MMLRPRLGREGTDSFRYPVNQADEVTRLLIGRGAANDRHGRGFGRRRDTALQIMRFGDTNRDQVPQRPIDPRTRWMRWREQSWVLDHHRLEPLHDLTADARRYPKARRCRAAEPGLGCVE